MKLSNRILAGVVVLGALAISPAAAQAGTVSVETAPAVIEGTKGEPNLAVLVFAAAPGERNEVTASQVAESNGQVTVSVRDAGAPLEVGSGCSGGGAADSAATCNLHGPVETVYEGCGKDCFRMVPGTAWRDRMRIELGDENDSFDGSAVPDRPSMQWNETVDGGSGDDLIVTGAGDDRIVPGPGNDVVHGNLGQDTAVADPAPDGNDLLDLGPGDLNYVDDSARREPLHLSDGILGAAGEEDALQGFDGVIGGSADDEFISSGEWLNGGPGNDTLIGSPGKDQIEGGGGNDTIRGEAGDDALYGGEGDDLMEGGPGNDLVEEMETPGKPFSPYPDVNGGNDTLKGGPGDDRVMAGPGRDTVDGGSGDDELFGEAGNDTIEGGPGDDVVAGEEGADLLRGGAGNDTLRSAQDDELLGKSELDGIDSSVDSLDCGPGADTSEANPWDRVRACEKRQTVRAVTVTGIKRNLVTGSAAVSFTTYAGSPAATLRVTGAGVHSASCSLPARKFGLPKYTFTVRPRRAAAATLRRRGRVKVTLRLTWHPRGGPAATEVRRVELILKGKRAGR